MHLSRRRPLGAGWLSRSLVLWPGYAFGQARVGFEEARVAAVHARTRASDPHDPNGGRPSGR